MTTTTTTTQKLTTEMDRIERNVLGRNIINGRTFEQLKNLLPQLETLIGKKVRKADFSKAATLDKISLIEFEYEEQNCISYRGHIRFTGNSLWLHNDITLAVQSFKGGGHGVNYYKKETYLGKTVDNGKLIEVYQLNENTINEKGLETNFKHEDVRKDYEKVTELKAEISRLEYSLAKFNMRQ